MSYVLFVFLLAASSGRDQPVTSQPEPGGGLQLVQHRPGGKNQFDEPPQGFGAVGTPPGLGLGGGMPPFPQQGQPPVFFPEPPVQQAAPARKQTEDIPPLVIWLVGGALALFIAWRMGNRTVRIVHRR